VSTVPASLIRYRQLLEDAIGRDLAMRRTRRRRRVVRLALAGAAASALALVLVSAVANHAPWAVGSASAESVVRRAAAAVGAKPGTILHVDMTGTQRNPDGSTVTWRDESWQLEGKPYSRRQIETASDGSTVESGSGPEGDQVYDPASNTIYVGPRPTGETPAELQTPHLTRGPKPGTYTLRFVRLSLVITARQAKAFRRGTLSIAWKVRKNDPVGTLALIPTPKRYDRPDSSDGADPSSPAFRTQILALLESGEARVVGHKTIDGRDTIEITSADGHTSYYVDPHTYEPVELDTTGTGGGVALRFLTYKALPARGNRGLLDLTAEHPNATVDRDAADYRAAQARLFPHG
jgi:hypothetical protein